MIIGAKRYPSLFLHGCEIETVTGRTGNDTSTNQNKNTKAAGSITIIIMQTVWPHDFSSRP